MNTTRQLVLLSALTVGCAGGAVSEVEDPQLEASGKAAGQQSAAIGELPSDAIEDDITAAVQTLGSSFQAIQSQHQTAYASARLTPSAAAALTRAAPGEVLWDGTTLSMNWSLDESSVSLSYIVDLTFTSAGDGFTIDGTYDLEYDASAAGTGVTYDLSVTYEGLTTDGSGCATGGALDLTYDYSVTAAGIDLPGFAGATDLSGRVRVEYNGCDDVTVLASN